MNLKEVDDPMGLVRDTFDEEKIESITKKKSH